MADRIIFVCTLVLAGVYFWATSKIPSLELGDPLGPKAFPNMLGAGLLIGAAMLLAEIIRGRRNAAASDGKSSKLEAHHGVVAAVAAGTAAYIVAFEPLGYVISTAAYLLVLTHFFNKGRHLMNALTGVLFALFSYLLFTKALGVNLPAGILPF